MNNIRVLNVLGEANRYQVGVLMEATSTFEHLNEQNKSRATMRRWHGHTLNSYCSTHLLGSSCW